MKPILIIKTGTTFPDIKTAHGDFEDWIQSGTGLPRSSFMVTPVYQDIPLPQTEYISGVIISGSHANVSEHRPWMERTMRWLKSAAQKSIPMLGICFGHQLLARAFGGEVDFHPGGWELGQVQVELTGEGKTDALFREMPHTFEAFASHAQTVTTLPPGARRLARNNFEPHHAFRLAEHVYGLQFHPEFNCAVMQAYLDKHGSRPNHTTLQPCRDSEVGAHLLKRFVTLIKNS